MSNINIAWWNVENLFDHEEAQRPAELASVLKSELKGWSVAIRDRKLDQLARAIKAMFNGAGPDLLGVSEAENETVLKLLAAKLTIPGRKYKVVNHPSPDARGIDISFLYDQNTLTPSQPGHHVVAKRRATRDLFWATFKPAGVEASFVALANHWPARSEGVYESEPFRMMVAETASYVLSKFLDEPMGDPDRAVVVMGDFNDEPFNRSIQEYLLGLRDAGQVLRARSPQLLNLMWPLMSIEQPGTLLFESTWNMLDQFLVSRSLLKKESKIRLQAGSTTIFRPPELRGKSGAPRKFGRPAEKVDLDGFADHFPICMVLEVS